MIIQVARMILIMVKMTIVIAIERMLLITKHWYKNDDYHNGRMTIKIKLILIINKYHTVTIVS